MHPDHGWIALHVEWLEAIRAWAAQHPRIAAVYLFGSRVRGTHRPDSDIDLAVILTEDEHDTASGYWAFESGMLWAELTTKLPVPLHLEAAFPDDERVMPAVKSYGIQLYRSPDDSAVLP